MIDVAQLLEDSETKTDALERVAELEEDLSQVTERLTEVEEEAMIKTGEQPHFVSAHFIVLDIVVFYHLFGA
jgi:hypothetical protein